MAEIKQRDRRIKRDFIFINILKKRSEMEIFKTL